MKPIIFAATALAALTLVTALASVPGHAAGGPANVAPAFNFLPPIKASATLNGVGRIVGGPDGAASIMAIQGSSVSDEYNNSLYGAFSTTTLDTNSVGIGNVVPRHDNAGRLWATWFRSYSDGSANLYYGFRNPGTAGTPWTVTAIPGSLTVSPNPYKVTDMQTQPGTGRAWVMYARNGVGAAVQFTDNGTNWSSRYGVPGPFSATAADFGLGVSAGGYVVVGWTDRTTTDILVQMRDPAGNWGPVTDIAPVAGYQGYAPRFAADPFGGLRVIWQQVEPGTAESDVWYREWTPAGGWNPTIVKLFTTTGNTAGGGYEISVDSSGLAHVVYQDDTLLGGAALAYYVQVSGTSVTLPQRLFPEFGNSSYVRFPSIDVNSAPGHFALAHVVGNTNYNNGGYAANWYTYLDLTPPATLTPTASPTATASPTPCTAGVFSDVHPSDYFYTPVNYLVSHGVVTGYPDCTFRPYNNTTRGQLAKNVALAFNVPSYTPPAGGHTFADVPTSDTFFSYIERVNNSSIVNGYACGQPGELCDSLNRPYYRPAVLVTRGQLSKVVVKARGWTLLNPSTATFSDVPVGSTFYTYVETAVNHGIIGGYSDGTFKPNNSATRGQISKIVYLAVTGP
jgi:hypothetical protein